MKGNSAWNNNEVNIMKSPVHAHIIMLFHMVQTREITYVIMEYSSKGELLYHIRKLGGLQEFETRRLFTQVLS